MDKIKTKTDETADDRLTERQTNRKIDGQDDRLTNKQHDWKTDKQDGRQTYYQAGQQQTRQEGETVKEGWEQTTGRAKRQKDQLTDVQDD